MTGPTFPHKLIPIPPNPNPIEKAGRVPKHSPGVTRLLSPWPEAAGVSIAYHTSPLLCHPQQELAIQLSAPEPTKIYHDFGRPQSMLSIPFRRKLEYLVNSTQSFQIPEQGQLVEVRNRRFVVVDIEPSTLAQSLIDTSTTDNAHLVTLSSIEDDALGEELQVIWELEARKQSSDDGTLPAPDGFDSPQRLDAFLNAVRWGAIVTADGRMIQAPFRSGIEIEDYQLDPVVRAVQMPRANLLIADDVGLGKTIEAGLVVQELIIRQPCATVLDRLPGGAADPVARSDARQVRPGVPHRRQRADARTAPHAWHPRQPVVALSPPDHVHRLPQARPAHAALSRDVAGRRRIDLSPAL